MLSKLFILSLSPRFLGICRNLQAGRINMLLEISLLVSSYFVTSVEIILKGRVYLLLMQAYL